MTPQGLDHPQSRQKHLFSVVMFFLLLVAGIGALVYATYKLEYTWRWHMVPHYFWDTSEQDIRSDVNGRVLSITHDDNAIILTLRASEAPNPIIQVSLSPSVTLTTTEGYEVYQGDVLAQYSKNQPGLLLKGLWITVKVSIISILLGIIIGLGTGLCRISGNPCLRWSAITYIEIIRGTPLLVQLFIWYYVAGTIMNKLLLSMGTRDIPPLWYGIFALAVFAGAYVAEIVRAGIQSVHWGQMEAARSLGMSHNQAMRKVILPQAFRRIMPPLAGQFISLVKDSSLLGVMGITELTKQTQDAISFTFQSFEFWFTCAFLYLVLTFTLSVFVQILEQKAIRR